MARVSEDGGAGIALFITGAIRDKLLDFYEFFMTISRGNFFHVEISKTRNTLV